MLDVRSNNCCLAAPGLAINTTTTVKYANTFSFKSNGRLSGTITTAAAPSLALATTPAPFPSGSATAVGVLTTGYYRIYTLVGTIPVNGSSTVTLAYSWVCSQDYALGTDVVNIDYAILPDAFTACPIGFVIVSNNSGSNWTPGTTNLSGVTGLTVTYVDNYGIALR